MDNVTLDPTMLIVVAALVALGYFFKQTPKIPDWVIGYVLLLLGIVAGLIKVGFAVDGVANGILAAALAVFGNTLYKQAFVKRIEDKKEV